MAGLDLVTLLLLIIALPLVGYTAYGQWTGKLAKPRLTLRHSLFVLLLVLSVVELFLDGLTLKTVSRFLLWLAIVYVTASHRKEEK